MKMIRHKKMMKLNYVLSHQARQSQPVSMKIWTMRIGTRSRCRHWELKWSNWDMIGVQCPCLCVPPPSWGDVLTDTSDTSVLWLAPPTSRPDTPEQYLHNLGWSTSDLKKLYEKPRILIVMIFIAVTSLFNFTYLASGRTPFWRSFQQSWKSHYQWSKTRDAYFSMVLYWGHL